jgi:hypothetical protein
MSKTFEIKKTTLPKVLVLKFTGINPKDTSCGTDPTVQIDKVNWNTKTQKNVHTYRTHKTGK